MLCNKEENYYWQPYPTNARLVVAVSYSCKNLHSFSDITRSLLELASKM